MTAAAISGVSPMPFVPPLYPGESLPSWIDRIAASNDLPRGLVLHRTGLADTTHHDDAPIAYGITLADARVSRISQATGVPEDRIRASLLSAYDGGPFDPTELDLSDPASITRVMRDEWVYGTGSHYCPDCLRESGGAWQLAWRLPWSFVCIRHQQLLVADCPACGRRAARTRADGATRPTFLTRLPAPGRCGNCTPSAAPPGRLGHPCGHDLTAVQTTTLRSSAAQPVIAAQEHLNTLLRQGGKGQEWRDLRALTAALLSVADDTTMTQLAALENLRHMTLSCLVDAIAEHAEHSDEHKRSRLKVIDGGRDGRSGPRRRIWKTTPTSPALMAALQPLVLALNSSESAGLTDLAAMCRARRSSLATLLERAHAGPALVASARQAALTTGRYAHQIRASKAHTVVDPRHIPAYLPVHHAGPFIKAFEGTGTRPDTVRKFASICAVMALTGDTYRDAAIRLGHAPEPIRTLATNLVNRLTGAGTLIEFRDAVQALPGRLAADPLIDYTTRRRALRTLRTVPADVLRPYSTVVTASRRRNGAAWVWAELTGGHPYEAPAWDSTGATESQREVYRRFTRDYLPSVREDLTAYGQALVGVVASDLERP